MTEYTLKEGDTVLIPNEGEVPYLYKRLTLNEVRDHFIPEQKIDLKNLMHVIS